MSRPRLGLVLALWLGLTVPLSTCADAASRIAIQHQQPLSPEVKRTHTDANPNCLSFEIEDMQFPETSSLNAKTITVAATVHLINGCNTTAQMSLILSDPGGSSGFTMHANNSALPLRLFVGTDSTGVEVRNGKAIRIGQLTALHPNLHLFGEVQASRSVGAGNYTDNISAILLTSP